MSGQLTTSDSGVLLLREALDNSGVIEALEDNLVSTAGVIEYMEMEYNCCRLHSTLSYQTPREIELAAAA